MKNIRVFLAIEPNNSIRVALSAVGILLDEKPFAAHLTLGRVKSSRNLMVLQDQLEKEGKT